MMRWIAALVVVAALAGAAGWILGSRSAAPAAPVAENYGGWRLDCGAAAGADCVISQRVVAQDNQAQLLQIVVSAPGDGQAPTLAVATPLGVWLPGGVTIRLGEADGQALPLSFARCQAGGCLADGPLSEAFLEQMRAGGQASVVVINRNQEGVAIPFALTGFEEAYAALRARESTLPLWRGLGARGQEAG